MKSLKIILFAGFLLLYTTVYGQKPNYSELTRVGNNAISEYFPDGDFVIGSVDSILNKEEVTIFILNLKPEGWILISGSKSRNPLIGFNYSDRFNKPERNKNNPASNWLESLSSEIRIDLDSGSKSINKAWLSNSLSDKGNNSKGIDVEPLIDVEWGQGTGWNIFCPEDASGPGGRAYVGCVAVAMAQALSVFQVPDTGTSSYYYSHPDYGDIMGDYENTAYKWDSASTKHPDIYNATILYHCATSVAMDFGGDGSSASTSASVYAMGEYFGMSKQMDYDPEDSNPSIWYAKIRKELYAGRPLIYRGDGNDGEAGHAFNVDGVLDRYYFHINWGWDGEYNGYFKLDELNPATRHNFNFNQAAIFGIQPYCYPTGVLLNDSTIVRGNQPGIALAEVQVIDEGSQDNTHYISVVSDSNLVEGAWIKDYYMDGDSLRLGKSFGVDDPDTDTITFIIQDIYNNYLETKIPLSVTGSGQSVSVPGIYEARLKIYPNPIVDFLTIQNSSSSMVASTKVFSLSGYKVYEERNKYPPYRLDLSHLTNGVYLIEVMFSDGMVERRKIIKQ